MVIQRCGVGSSHAVRAGLLAAPADSLIAVCILSDVDETS